MENYDERARVVLFNLCHGVVPVEYSRIGKTDKFDFPSIIAPTDTDKLLKAPTGICSISSETDRMQSLQKLHEVCWPYSTGIKKFDDDEFMERCKEKLILSSDDLKSQVLPSAPIQRRSQPTQRFSDYFKNISECTNTFEYVKSRKGEKIKNKKWGPSNMSVIFELPYTPTGLPFDILNTGNITLEPNLRTRDNVYPRPMFDQPIGRVSIVDGKHYIRYYEGTNLLTCPYFIEYTLRSNPDVTKENMHDYVVKHTTFRGRFELNMPRQIDANILYSYFQHVPSIKHIDMSCDTLGFIDPTGEKSSVQIANIFATQPGPKRERILNGFNSDGSFPARGSKRKRKSRQTKSKQKKSRKTRKNRK
jgi:hypothetical protein